MISKYDEEYFNYPEIKCYLNDCEDIEEEKNMIRDTVSYNKYILHRECQGLIETIKSTIRKKLNRE